MLFFIKVMFTSKLVSFVYHILQSLCFRRLLCWHRISYTPVNPKNKTASAIPSTPWVGARSAQWRYLMEEFSSLILSDELESPS